MTPCSSCSGGTDCFKASFQFKLAKATGKASDNTTGSQWFSSSDISTGDDTSKSKSLNTGTNFDAAG